MSKINKSNLIKHAMITNAVKKLEENKPTYSISEDVILQGGSDLNPQSIALIEQAQQHKLHAFINRILIAETRATITFIVVAETLDQAQEKLKKSNALTKFIEHLDWNIKSRATNAVIGGLRLYQ